MTKHIYCDVVIAGCGAAGLYTALNLPKDLHVLMICKEDMDTCDSMLAQGGICVLRGEDDYESYFEDTMRAGHYENRKESVDLMIRTSPDILTANGACAGILARTGDGSTLSIHARDTVMATGGIGGLYQHSTNFPCLTGDALTVARKHGVKLEHLDYVQIHPTSLYAEKPGRSFLISESARGEGAVLLNGKGERFVNELLPRDAVSQAIEAEMEREGSRHVWLSFAPMPRETIREHFPHIYETCLEEGYDITREPIPVVPAQHYFMGGVWVDLDSRTTMEHLYAVGETSCNGVHGKNRLASNSLLESLVFAEKAAKRIENSQKGRINYESNYHAACC